MNILRLWSLQLLKACEGGTHISDEDGGAEFEGDPVLVVGQPEGGITLELFVGEQFEGR